MQIEFVNRPQHFNILEDAEIGLVRGNSGYGVRLGNRLVGFSAEDVASLAIQVREGALNIRLISQQGEKVGEYRVPSAAVLQQNMSELTEAGIYFNSAERDDLVKLMNLSMSSTVTRGDILLLLDEVSHIAPRLEASAQIDTGDLHPNLQQQVRGLLKAMPEEIQRFVILNNYQHIPEEDWHAFQYLSKVDAGVDLQAARFISGQTPVNYEVTAELEAVLARGALVSPQPIEQLDQAAFKDLATWLVGREIAGNPRIFSFPPAVASYIFDTYNLDIPSFTDAASFDELEQQLLSRLQRETAGRSVSRDPLASRLLSSLDTNKYRELADFLVGKPGVRFNMEVRESLRHFVNNLAEKAPHDRLSSLSQRALERVRHFLASAVPDLETRLQKQPGPELRGETTAPGAGVAARFARLKPLERVALFVLDHLDPVRHKNLFKHFDGSNRLARMTPTMEKDLARFLKQAQFPHQQQGLSNFSKARFTDLVATLKRWPGLAAPLGYLPENPVLQDALADLAEEAPKTRPHAGRSTGKRPFYWNQPTVAANLTPSKTELPDWTRPTGKGPTVAGTPRGGERPQATGPSPKLLETGRKPFIPKGRWPAVHVNPGSTEGHEPSPAQSDGSEKGNLRALARALTHVLHGVPETELDQLVTGLLRRHLRNFKQVAILDQAWKAQPPLETLIREQGHSVVASREIRKALHGLTEVLSRKEDPDIRWDLWRKGSDSKTAHKDPNPPLRERVLASEKGLARYLTLDKLIPPMKGDLEEQARELSWVRRIEHVLGRIENSKGDAAKQVRFLTRFQAFLQELTEQVGQDQNQKQWNSLAQSPLLKRKAMQFLDFRQGLLKGDLPDPGPLFEGPFLRSELGERAERQQKNEMKRFEPPFREMLARLEQGPEELVRKLLDMASQAAGKAGVDMADRMRHLVEGMGEFNQHQNLNEQPLYLSLPLRHNGEESEMELAYFRIPRSKEDPNRFLVVIHLDSTSWGQLRVDALKENDTLTATFWVDNRHMQSLLMKDLHLLEDRLEAAGLKEAALNVKFQPERAAASVAEMCMPNNEGEIDLSI